MTQAIAIGVFTTLSIIALFIGLRYLIEGSVTLNERLDAELVARGAVRLAGRTEETPRLVERIDHLLRRFDFSQRMSRQLVRAGIHMTVTEYLMLRGAIAGLAFAVTYLLTEHLMRGLLVGGIGLLTPPYYVAWRRYRRQKAFEDQLEDVLTLLTGALRAGYSLLHALNLVVDEISPPASEEFRRVIREVGLGLSLTEALENLVERVDSKDLELMVAAIAIQQEVGGNLAAILDTISETIRERVRIQGEIRTLTTQQKMTGYILALLPIIVGVVLYLINPTYMERLFQPGITRVIPVVAAIGMLLGFLIIRRIVDIEV